eukprot:scaffold307260_cov32-Tisochrysis_lutea.AAC.1
MECDGTPLSPVLQVAGALSNIPLRDLTNCALAEGRRATRSRDGNGNQAQRERKMKERERKWRAPLPPCGEAEAGGMNGVGEDERDVGPDMTAREWGVGG